MQVNSIQSYNYVNRFNQNGYQKQNLEQNNTSAQAVNFTASDKSTRAKVAGPLLAAMMVPVALFPTGCVKVTASANAYHCDHCGTPTNPIVIPPNDTIYRTDTIYIPPTFEFPQEIHDSLNFWRGDILDLPAEGDETPNVYNNKVLVSAGAVREWDFQRPEVLLMNLAKSRGDEAYYDHIIKGNALNPDSVVNDVRVTLVKPNKITIVRKNGTETRNVGGLMFNEDGKKVFMHSNGRDKIYVYVKDTDRNSETYGKFVELGTAEPGDLEVSEDGLNVKLTDLLGENTIDYFTHGAFTVMTREQLEELRQKSLLEVTGED